jgi:hypothetical protein
MTSKTLVLTAVDKAKYMRSNIQNSLGNLMLHNLHYLKMPHVLDTVNFELVRLSDMELPRFTSTLSDSECSTVAISSHGQRYWAVCESVVLIMHSQLDIDGKGGI